MKENKKPILLQDLGMMYPIESSKKKRRFGMYQCPFCYNNFIVQTQSIIRENTKSCGCSSSKLKGDSNRTHGLRQHKIYPVWSQMKARCFNPDHKDFKYYGGRGISVCDRWLKFENFIQDMIASWGDGLSIDRINNDGNYEPSNCRWATVNIQRRNTCLLRGNNTSGYRGVSFNKRDKRWMATISIDGKHKTIGYFSTALESAQAYDKFVIENNFEHTINGVCHENI